ncbi:class I SAM-dependent methyltransferase [bacterium]|nr:class I SAM-dependent methyltransferase [bacterium]
MSYLSIVKHYENCLAVHGDSHKGVDWPNAKDADKRYEVMLDLLPSTPRPIKLLDLGCGASHLLDFITKNKLKGIEYVGLDASKDFVRLSRGKNPENRYICSDLLKDELPREQFDYVVINGVFTIKGGLSNAEMFEFVVSMLTKVKSLTRFGFAFNVMSKFVDWERDDLFHLSYDELAEYLTKNISRKFVIRSDYGLYDYTVYVYL